jgi:hypothetical protein
MKTARMDATATLLADGRVLIAGGSSAESGMVTPSALASAELYDPATGTFTPTGSMFTARSTATATLLADGKVLIAGGFGCPGKRSCPSESGSVALSSAELYDPATGTFSPTGAMAETHCSASAVLLADGRVAIVAGQTKSVEMYDPASGKFSRLGSLANDYRGSYADSCWGGAAVSLPSGSILVIGPSSSGPVAEFVDPVSGKTTPLEIALPDGALAAAKSGSYDGLPITASLLKDGRVLLCIFDYLVAYDPASGGFSQLGTISSPGRWFLTTSILLRDGRVLLAGGIKYSESGDFTSTKSASAGLFDPAGGFQPVASLRQARLGYTATVLKDGRVLIAGGDNEQGKAMRTCELFQL